MESPTVARDRLHAEGSAEENGRTALTSETHERHVGRRKSDAFTFGKRKVHAVRNLMWERQCQRERRRYERFIECQIQQAFGDRRSQRIEGIDCELRTNLAGDNLAPQRTAIDASRTARVAPLSPGIALFANDHRTVEGRIPRDRTDRRANGRCTFHQRFFPRCNRCRQNTAHFFFKRDAVELRA